MTTDSDVLERVKINTTIKPPAVYSVVYFNDEKTSADFVVRSLMDVFGMSLEDAMILTSLIDTIGSGAAASGLSKELASHLRDLVLAHAQVEGFPLVVEVRED